MAQTNEPKSKCLCGRVGKTSFKPGDVALRRLTADFH